MGEDRGDLGEGKWFASNQLLELFRGDDLIHRKGLLTLDAGEVVEVFPNVVAAALAEVNVVFYPDNQIVEVSCCDLGFLQFHGALHHGLVGEGEALGLQGAEQAVGVLGRAVQGAELHQGLVV